MRRFLPRRTLDALALAFVLSVTIGGWFFPVAGLALAVLMAAAVALSLKARFGSARRRAFCNGVCPRGRALGFALRPISRGRTMPKAFSELSFRRGLCGFMMFCVLGSLVRALPGLEGLPAFAAAGRIFWGLCLISLAGGLALGILYRPRAWCVVCPMGTLQDTITGPGERSANDRGSEPRRQILEQGLVAGD
jgi:polyferredoxin